MGGLCGQDKPGKKNCPGKEAASRFYPDHPEKWSDGRCISIAAWQSRINNRILRLLKINFGSIISAGEQFFHFLWCDGSGIRTGAGIADS